MTDGKNKQYRARDFDKKRKKFYHLVMFPYPSGDLHIGHWYNFAPADIYARKKLMEGYNVLSPIGFDAFGLPAENAAIKHGIDPETWTYQNIKRMRDQLKSIGAMYDWSREVITADPSYYKWTQWLFLQLYKNGLAYRAKIKANWCPSCQTVLANEQVVNGECERCGNQVAQKLIDQWLFKITDYADRLLEDLDNLDWPEKTKAMQRNWIGRSPGRMIKFPIKGSSLSLEVFTTRPDTIKGVTYMVVAPEHPFISKLKTQISNVKVVEDYIKKSMHKTERERLKYDKSGVDLGLKAINPITGEKLPIWLADYVLMGYGTGAIMAVPAHDKRDRQFAEANNLPIGSRELTDHKDVGQEMVAYRLRDWLISRQRYWGVPVPVVYCDNCGIQPVDEKDLPVKLPKIKDYLPKGKPPLAMAKQWVKTTCPNCQGPADREVETMDTFVDSSWYFLRYADSKNSKVFANAENLKYWLPVDIYIGGAEHSVLHLLYARFFTKALYDLKLLNFDEPFPKLRHQGVILGTDRQKMSKSRGNVIDPDVLVAKYGADAVRLFLCFMGPYEQGGSWSDEGLQGVARFLNRVGRARVISKSNVEVTQLLHKTIKKVSNDIESLSFNTAVSTLMIFQNIIDKQGISEEDFTAYLKILAPFAPFFTQDLWLKLGKKRSIFDQDWPVYNEKLAVENRAKIAVQIDGKTKKIIDAPIDARRFQVEHQARQMINPIKAKKIIYIAGKIINFVVS